MVVAVPPGHALNESGSVTPVSAVQSETRGMKSIDREASSADEVSERLDRERVSLVMQHVELREGFYVLNTRSAVEAGLDARFAAEVSRNLEKSNREIASGGGQLSVRSMSMTAASNSLLDCLMSVGGLSLAQASLLLALVASGVGIFIAAASFGLAAIMAVRACCPRYCG